MRKGFDISIPKIIIYGIDLGKILNMVVSELIQAHEPIF